MSIGRSGIKNIAFVEDEDGIVESIKDSEDNVSIRTKFDQTNPLDSTLYRGEKLTNRGVILIVSLAATIFAGSMSYSLIAPFFPRTAEKKGLTISEYSIIFAVYEIVGFILPPFSSKVAMKITPKIFLMISLFITASFATIFGFLVFAEDGNQFLILCIIVRCFWAVGGASSTCAVYLCGALLFPNHIPLIYSAIEIGAGLGFMAGPFIGGYLFELGGFPLPFVVTAVFCLLSIFPIGLLIENKFEAKGDKKEKSTTFLQTMRVPGVTINLIISSVTCFCIGFNESTLDHHLREISNFSPVQVGRIFLISGLIYSIFTYAFGSIAKRWSKNCYYLVFLGLFLVTCSFTIVGPLPFIPLQPHVINVIISQCCFGVGMGALFVLSFDDCVKEAKKYLPHNDSTMAQISGLYTSSYAFGTAIGPFVGGQLVERFGYRIATTPMVLTMISLTVLVTIYVFKIKKDPKIDCVSSIRTVY